MFTLRFTKCEPSDEVVVENLRQLAPSHNMDLILKGVLGWLNVTDGATLRDMELRLRKEELDVYLVADSNFDRDMFGLNMKNKSADELEHHCFVICREKEPAKKEFMERYRAMGFADETYEELVEINLERLSKTGFLGPKNAGGANMFSSASSPSEESMGPYRMLQYGRVLVEREVVDPMEQFVKQYKLAKEKFGEEPEGRIIGLGKTGGPIMGFYVKDHLVSDLGIHTYHNDKGEKVNEVYPLSQLMQ